jgi:hypothetical protein
VAGGVLGAAGLALLVVLSAVERATLSQIGLLLVSNNESLFGLIAVSAVSFGSFLVLFWSHLVRDPKET